MRYYQCYQVESLGYDCSFYPEEIKRCKSIPMDDFTLSGGMYWILSRTELGKTASTHLTPVYLPGRLQIGTRD